MRLPLSRLRAARLWGLALMVASVATLTGCASLPPPPSQPETRALANPASTPLGQLVQRVAPAGGRSGFRNLIAGDEALDARLALADNAQKTLDLQYYIVTQDTSTLEVLDRVRAAAVRGVRVRLLLDDLNTSGADATLDALIREPNVEVRLYNPFPNGRGSTITRVLTSLTDIPRINRRMHNKLFIADNALGITGGRNLGNAYFVQSAASNFVDLDLLVAGRAVRALSASFDVYWNNPLAYPARMFIPAQTPEAIADARRIVVPATTTVAPAAEQVVPPRALLSDDLRAGRLPLVWAPSRVLADNPSKLEHDEDPAPDETLVDDMEKMLRGATRNVTLISPYFVPGKRGTAVLRTLRDRGVTVKILTNSLAANDAPLVHIGYVVYRSELLRMGVQLSELKPSVGDTSVRLGSFGSSTSRLHAKALVVDGRLALIGSMNFDPRSDKLNSEIGVLVDSPSIAQQVVDLYDAIAQQAAYALSLDERGHVRWTDPAAAGGPPLGAEPGSKLWMRLSMKLLSPLAPEEML